jgi:hypothetical protein
MIGKKMLLWIGAGVLSVASIPAIGATVSHRHQSARSHAVAHKTAPVAHASRARSHAKLTHRTTTHKKLATKRSHASTAHKTYGVTSMHSGRTNSAKPTAKTVSMKSTAKPRAHLLAARKH